MSVILEQKCPKCGGTTHFDPKTQMLVCDYCDSIFPFDIEKVQSEAVTEDFRFEDFAKGYESPDAESLPIYLCESCGAELIAPAEQISLTCPYCGNHIVLSDKVSGNLRPNGIIPFKVAAKELPDLLRTFYQDKKLLPKSFFSDAAMSKITGVYVPFWIFSGRVVGSASFIASLSSTRKEGDYIITDTSFYEVQTGVDAAFQNIPVDASKRISDKMMDSLEPFDMGEVKPFDVGYLAGFTSDRFDSSSDDMEARAKGRIDNTANSLLAAQAGSFEKIKIAGGDLKTTLSAQYYLLPVYLFKLRFLNKDYAFAVNGQSGRIVGELPSSAVLSRIYFLKRFIPISMGVLLAFILKYFLGG